MTIEIRRLQPGDEAVLEYLATNDADFDVAGRGSPLKPLPQAAAHAYLVNDAVLFWITHDDKRITGFLSCVLIPLRANGAHEILLYEIGVHHS